MSQYVTLEERYRRKMEHLRSALEEVDGLLTVYARQHGGRFIRFGSTALGSARQHRDVDIVADFPGHASMAAAGYAEDLLNERGLKADVSPSAYVSDSFIANVAAVGIILSCCRLWSDVAEDLALSRHHLRQALEIAPDCRFDEGQPGPYLYVAAFMHAMMAGYTSFEAALKRIYAILEEPLPVGHDWHAVMLKRAGRPLEHSRPAILTEPLLQAADELRRFRHVAMHVYDRFEGDRARKAAMP